MSISILDVLRSILKANILAVCIVLIVYIFEISFGLRVFIKYFMMDKDKKKAEIAADGNTGFYIVFCFVVFLIDTIKGNINISFINVICWAVIVMVLSLTFHHLYDKYQSISQ